MSGNASIYKSRHLGPVIDEAVDKRTQVLDSAPTSETVGVVGQLAIYDGKIYRCSAVTEVEGEPTTYTWLLAVELVFANVDKANADKLNGKTIVTTLGTDNTTIPTSGAVKAKFDSLTLGDMLKSVYDTNNDGVVDNASKVNNKSTNTTVTDSDSYVPTSKAVKTYVDNALAPLDPSNFEKVWTLRGTLTISNSKVSGNITLDANDTEIKFVQGTGAIGSTTNGVVLSDTVVQIKNLTATGTAKRSVALLSAFGGASSQNPATATALPIVATFASSYNQLTVQSSTLTNYGNGTLLVYGR